MQGDFSLRYRHLTLENEALCLLMKLLAIVISICYETIDSEHFCAIAAPQVASVTVDINYCHAIQVFHAVYIFYQRSDRVSIVTQIFGSALENV